MIITEYEENTKKFTIDFSDEQMKELAAMSEYHQTDLTQTIEDILTHKLGTV